MDEPIYDDLVMTDIPNDLRDLQPGISAHFMVLDPPIARLAEKVALIKPYVNEVIIVDTGSSAEDVEIMRSWNGEGGVPVYVVYEPFIGFGPTRTRGYARHHHEWTWIQDPDELPTVAALEHMRSVVSSPNKHAIGYLYLSLNWWGGRLGPFEEHHWHVRLMKTRGTFMYRDLHELASIGGKDEPALRGTKALPKAPEEAFVIHSKGAVEILKSDALYAEMGGHSVP